MSWPDVQQDVKILVDLAGWKPWKIMKLTRRDRRYWTKVYMARAERQRNDQMFKCTNCGSNPCRCPKTYSPRGKQ